MKHDEVEKASDIMHEMQIGEIKISYWSPAKEMGRKDCMMTPKTVPSNRWFSMVEEDEEAMSRYAPPGMLAKQQIVVSSGGASLASTAFSQVSRSRQLACDPTQYSGNNHLPNYTLVVFPNDVIVSRAAN
jgi:hypothetical protein